MTSESVAAELSDCRSVGVWAPGPIGDLVMATPAFSALHVAFPEARRVAYVGGASAALLNGSEWFQEVVTRTKDVGAMATRLRRERHDLMLLQTGSFRSAWIAWRGGASRRVGYASGVRRLLLSRAIPRLRGRHSQDPAPMVESYLELLRCAGIPAPEEGVVSLPVTAEERAEADRLLAATGSAKGKLLAVSPGAAYGPAKRWPAPRFASLIRLLLDEPALAVRVAVLFAPEEAALVREIVDAVGDDGGRVFAQQTALGPSKAILERAALHVTCDTGSRHIGHAVGAPTLSILGPTHPEWSTYPGQIGEVLRVDVPCGPCMKRSCPIQSHDCMVDISVQRVFEVARRLLSEAEEGA